MPPRIALVHATALAIEPIADAFARLWPEARLTNLLDDSLSADRAAAGALTEAMVERFRVLARYCGDSGADAILFTCSAFGPAIEAARDAVQIPVVKPNEGMLGEALDAAARGAGRLAMVATFEPSLDSMAGELKALAGGRGQSIELRTRHVPGAMPALDAGNGDRHDRLIDLALDDWDEWRECDALLLAQFSMARAGPALRKRVRVPVLASTDSAVAAVRRAIDFRNA